MTPSTENKIRDLATLIDTFNNESDPAAKAIYQTQITAQIASILPRGGNINDSIDPVRRSGRSTRGSNITLTHYAVENNMLPLLEYLQNTYKGSTTPIDFNAKDKDGHSVLYYAADGKNKDVLRFFTREGIDPTTDPDANSLLLTNGGMRIYNECLDAQNIENASRTDFYRVLPVTDIHSYLTTGLHNINAVDDNGWNVAHHIAQFSREDVLKELIKEGVNFYATDKNGKTVLDMIADPELKERIQKAYQEKLAQTNFDTLNWATAPLDQVKSLAEQGADVKAGPYAHRALKANRPDIVEYLIDQGIDLNAVDTDGKTLVQLACESGNTPVLMKLVEHSFQDPATRVNWTPGTPPVDYLTALRGSNPTLADKVQNALNATESLLDPSSAPPPLAGKTWTDITPAEIEQLVADGAQINAQNDQGKSPLFLAVENNNMTAFAYLFASPNTRLDVKNNNGENIVFQAADSAILPGPPPTLNTEFLEVLGANKEHRPDFNARRTDGATAFHVALERAHSLTPPLSNIDIERLAKTMIDGGADFALKDASKTPPKDTLDYITDTHTREEIAAYIENKKAEEERESYGPVETPEKDSEGNNPSNPGRNSPGSENGGDGSPEDDKSKPGEFKRVSDALKGATDEFFKNVFEANHKTAEDMAQAFLFNLLAFPIEAANIYLTKVYGEDEKDKLDKLINQVNQLIAQKNGLPNPGEGGGRIPTSEKTRNLMALAIAMRAADPVAAQLLSSAIGETTPPDLNNMTPEQLQERARKIQQELQRNPDLMRRFQGALSTVVQTPAGKEAFKKSFEGYNGPVKPEQVLEIFGVKNTPDGRTPPDPDHPGPTPGPGPTPRVQDAIKQAYEDIMNSSSTDKDKKIQQLEVFLSKQAEDHPKEFKTLAMALALNGSKKAVLSNLTRTGNTNFDRHGNLKNTAATALMSRRGFEDLSIKEVKEAVEIASTLKRTLRRGSDAGKSYLDREFFGRLSQIEH